MNVVCLGNLKMNIHYPFLWYIIMLVVMPVVISWKCDCVFH